MFCKISSHDTTVESSNCASKYRILSGEIKLQLNHNMQLRLGGLNQSQLFHRFRLRYSHNRSVGMIDFYILILFSV